VAETDETATQGDAADTAKNVETVADSEDATKSASTDTPVDQSETKVAVAKPAEDNAASVEQPDQAQAEERSEYELVVALQKELKRVGCYTGRIDGAWGRGSRWALKQFVRRAKTSNLSDVSEDTINAVQALEKRVCRFQRAKKKQTKRKPRIVYETVKPRTKKVKRKKPVIATKPKKKWKPKRKTAKKAPKTYYKPAPSQNDSVTCAASQASQAVTAGCY